MTDSIDIFDLPSKIISVAARIGAGCNVLEAPMRQPYSQTLNDAKVGADEKAAGRQNCVKLASADHVIISSREKIGTSDDANNSGQDFVCGIEMPDGMRQLC